MKKLTILGAFAFATPAFAASKNPFSASFYSLANTDFVVLISFLIFIGVLVYFKVPSILAGLLDKRAEGIQSELDEARALLEEAKSIEASYNRKKQEVAEQVERMKQQAKESAAETMAQAERDLDVSVERRLAAAKDQIASAEQSAIKQVRDKAAQVAIAAAGDVIAGKMSAKSAGSLIDDAIKTVEAKLH